MTRSPSSRIRGPFKGVHVSELSSRMKFSLLRLSVHSSPTLDTSVRAYSPRRLLYKSKTGEKSTRSERTQESGVERVGWRSLSGWVADTGRDACCREVGRGKGGCTLEEAVGVGEWAVGENRDSRIEKGRRYRRGRVLWWQRERGGRAGGGGQDRVRETAEVGVKNPTRN